jgi:hypothetical protein
MVKHKLYQQLHQLEPDRLLIRWDHLLRALFLEPRSRLALEVERAQLPHQSRLMTIIQTLHLAIPYQ